MNKRKKNKIDISFIMIWIVLLFFILIVIGIVNVLENKEEVEYHGNLSTGIEITYTNSVVESEKDIELEKIQGMKERNRIEYYVTKFINYLEAEKYDEAYELLNKTYKQNYFKTVKDFKEYAQTNFSKMVNVEYTNFERSGDVYVIWANITDAINGEPNSGKEFNFVVKENTYNDFELSFSAN